MINLMGKLLGEQHGKPIPEDDEDTAEFINSMYRLMRKHKILRLRPKSTKSFIGFNLDGDEPVFVMNGFIFDRLGDRK